MRDFDRFLSYRSFKTVNVETHMSDTYRLETTVPVGWALNTNDN